MIAPGKFAIEIAVDRGAERRPTGIKWGLVIGAMLMVFALDRSEAAAPYQHLYYVPIVFAAMTLDPWAGPVTAVGAVVLYHLANPALFSTRYQESDFVQIALFLASGAVAAKLAHDARRLARLAETDDLTGLYNLRGFDARVPRLVGASRRTRTPLSVLVLDVDRLKSLNDTYGHRAGADAVRVVGQILATSLPAAAIGCRFGGDEFVVALPGCDVNAARGAADALRAAVHLSTPTLADTRFPATTLSISIGLACLSFNDDDVPDQWPTGDREGGELLFRNADQALYLAKNSGRNRVTVTCA